MKHVIIFIAAVLSCLTGFAQGGYNPENPGDPNPYRKLTVVASPKAGGEARTNCTSQVGVGQSVSCYAYNNRYYDFVHWLKNGEIVSTASRFSFVMPDENVEMIAVFELNYNPQSPGDPEESRPSHRVTLTASPGKGGHFNNSVFKLCEGDSINIYAYPNEGYQFEEWQLNGVLVSTKNPLMIKMTDKDLNYTARFSYNPSSPADPAINLFNPGTGEMVIDRFKPGSLSGSVYGLLGNDYSFSDIQSLVVCGLMEGYDFGPIGDMSNCQTIDLSRTNGYTEIPSYAFESMTALTDLFLPSCISSIGRYAFTDCENLSAITCYALVPPTLAYGVFDGVDNSVIIKVPPQAIELYKNAPGWKDFTILPADTNVFSISVSLPDDAKDGRYRNMSIELLNITNGQRYKYLITDKTEYVFGNLLSSTRYNVSVKNSKNEILGEIADLEVVDKDLTTTFQSLRQPRNVSLKVLAPDGKDATSDVTIKWFNEANELLQQGATLSGVLENSVVSYTMTLSDRLQQNYRLPEVRQITVSEQNDLTYTLDELGRCILTGKVCDADGSSLNAATVTISKNINGSYTNSETILSDNEGTFSLEIPDVPLKVTISANGYIAQTKDLPSASAGIGDIVLEKNTGITVYPSYTYTESGSSQTSSLLISDSNIAYRIEDLEGNEIPGCIYQPGAVILPDNINIGDEINVVAYSKNNRFRDVSTTVTIGSKKVNVVVDIVEYGGISVTADESSAANGICLLYDASGKQIAKSAFRGTNASFEYLPDGKYTLISMRKSSLLGSVTNLSSFRETQLVEGRDYLLDNVNVSSGQTAGVTIADIPDLDETKLYYTDSKGTYFMPNKTQLTIGNYLTLKAKLTIKDEYAAAVDAATLIVDIPSGCEFVENSVISGSGYLGYEYANNRLSIPVQNLTDAVRFCIMPLEGGECKPSAFVRLVIDNQEILQPIGSANFTAKNFSLSTTTKTAKTTINVRGTATPDSEVKIYDNGNLVGVAFSTTNGEWGTKITFVKPYTYSLHDIHAVITNSAGRNLMTETKTVDYNKSYNDLEVITMIYGKNKFTFDQINGVTNIQNYIYWVHPDQDGYQPAPVFTFTADFNNNDPESIKNVVFKVKMLNGSIRRLPGEYNVASGNWIATSEFSETQAPVNVTAEFDISVDNNTYCEEAFNDQIQGLVNASNHILQELENNASLNVSVDEDDRFEGQLIYKGNTMIYKGEIIDYDYAFNQLMNEYQFYLNEVDGDKIYYNVQSTDSEITYTVIDSAEKLALKIVLGSEKPSKASRAWEWVTAMRESFNNGVFLRNISGLAGFWLDVLGVLEYANVRGDFNLMMDNAVKYADNFLKMDQRTHALILAKCKNGEYRLGPSQMKLAYIDKEGLNERTEQFSDRYYQYLEDYKTALKWNLVGFAASFGVGKLIGAASKFIKEGGSVCKWYHKNVNSNTKVKEVGGIVTNSLGIAYAVAQNGTDKIIHPAFYDFNGVRDNLWTWASQEAISIAKGYIDLNAKIERAYHKCPEDEDNDNNDDNDDDGRDDDFPTPPITPSIDPSGYVYEAVPSNRLEGVTATAYYKQQTEDMYGDITETAVVWDAAPFNQENPLITDAQGMYAWDVPAGMWQVRFEKEGYEPAQSAWLPVPPPQLDVNVAMTQAKQPEVKAVHAYSDGITIEFDKFMLPSTLAIGNITVTQNGNIVNGTVEASDMELDANGNAFCSKIEFKPDKLLADGEATLFVSKAVKSYANLNMCEDFMQTFTVEPRVSEIDVERNIEVASGGSTTLTATVLPATTAKDKTVIIEALNTMIASVSSDKAVIDENGTVSFEISGLVPGSTGIKLSVEGYDTEALVNVDVVAPRAGSQVAKPYASVESGEIKYGTEIFLYCQTPDAVIYYTIDGSCPCDADRLRYDGTPIIADKEFTLKIMAVADGMEDSEIAEYNYSVEGSGLEDMQVDRDLSIYPLPLGDYLNISNGGILIDSVSLFSLNGDLVLSHNKPEYNVSMKVGVLSQGIYILKVTTNGRAITKKVFKR